MPLNEPHVRMPLYSLTQATSLIAKGHAQYVLQELVAWTEEKPLDLAARYVLAHAYESTGQWPEAEAVWQDAKRLVQELKAERNSRALQSRAVHFELTDELEDSLEILLRPRLTGGRVPSEPSPQSEEELQHLIQELESARMTRMPIADDFPAPQLEDDVEGMVSETLARIHVSQGQLAEAADIFEQLAAQRPEDANRFRKRAAELRAQSEDGNS